MKKHLFNIPAIVTVEASLIFPLIILIMAFIITFCFYLHDKIVSNSLSYRDLIYASSDVNENFSSYFDNDALEKNINSFLLMYEAKKTDLRYESGVITVLVNYMNNHSVHTYSNFLYCDKLRKYSTIFKTIKEAL